MARQSVAVQEMARRLSILDEDQRKSLSASRAKEIESVKEAEEEAIAKALTDADDLGYNWNEPVKKKAAAVPPLLRPCYNRTLRSWRRIIKPYVNDNTTFDLVTTVIILASAVLMGIEAEVGLAMPGAEKPLWIVVSNHVINALFLIEWALRFIVGGAPWMKDWMNILFTFSVWAPVVFFAFGDKLDIIRIIIRILRVGKVLHTIKNVKGLRVIWLLLSGLFSSAGTLFWSCLLLFASVCFFSIIAVDLIGFNSAWEGDFPEGSPPRMFTTLSSSMFAMTRFMSSDGAMDIVEYLMQVPWVRNPKLPTEGQPYIWMFLFAFQALSQYVILNLITAVIVDNSMKIINEDEAANAADAEEEKKRQIKDLGELFLMLDADGSGEVDAQEFDSAFEIPALKNKLLLLGLEENELKRLYRALDSDGSGSMNVDEFCEGIPELFGQATAYGMLKAKKKAEKAEKQLRKMLSGSSVSKSKRKKKKDDDKPREDTAGEKELQDEINNLQADVEARLQRLDDMVKATIISAQRIGEALSSVK